MPDSSEYIDAHGHDIRNPNMKPDRVWLAIQAIATFTIILTLGMSILAWKQNQDRERVRTLAVSTRQRACDLKVIRDHIPAETARDRATDAYDSNNSLDCAGLKLFSFTK